MYDISDLEIFLSISKTLNLSKVAEQLNMAQSTISKKLKNLETELSITLVERNKGTKTLCLTEAGINFLDIANEMTALWSKAHELDSRSFRPVLTVASLSSLNQTIFAPMFTHIHEEHPELKLNILTVHSDEIYPIIENRQADIGFTLIEKIYPTVTVKKWYSEPMVVLRSPKAKFPKNKIFSPQELDPEEEIFYATGITFSLWHDQWFPPYTKCSIQLDSVSLVPRFLADINHWCILPLSIARFLQELQPYQIFPLAITPPPRICYNVIHRYPTVNTLKALQILKPYLMNCTAKYNPEILK
ncbi:MAG: LysR family transcriptional regulator [Megasphaera sp.]|jgi:DNA-binding transcriptional LysR family regulator|nr:LysR family transcriptional regulator [Megasphaera sp.]